MSTSEGSPSNTGVCCKAGAEAAPGPCPWHIAAPVEANLGLPLRVSGAAKFGFEGEPPEGWASEERRSLADWRLREQIEEGAPEPLRFPWGVLALAALFVLAVVGCIGGALWALFT